MTAPAVENLGGNLGMIAQPHGGTLKRGNRVGVGRRPNAIRKAALRILSRNIHVLEHIASGVTTEFVEDGNQVLVTPRPSERIAALKLAGELGMGETIKASEVRSRMNAQLDLIASRPTWETGELLKALDAVWK
jgi:hypothetical protein